MGEHKFQPDLGWASGTSATLRNTGNQPNSPGAVAPVLNSDGTIDSNAVSENVSETSEDDQPVSDLQPGETAEQAKKRIPATMWRIFQLSPGWRQFCLWRWFGKVCEKLD